MVFLIGFRVAGQRFGNRLVEPVEQLPVASGIEERLVLVLPVNVDQKPRGLLHLGGGRHLPVDAAETAPVGADAPRKEDFPLVQNDAQIPNRV